MLIPWLILLLSWECTESRICPSGILSWEWFHALPVLSMEYETQCSTQVFQDANMLKIFRALFFSKEKCIIFIERSWTIVKEELNLFVPDFEILNLYKNIRSQTNFNLSKAVFYESTERWGKCDVPSWPLFHRKNDLVTKAEQEGLDWLCFPFCFS